MEIGGINRPAAQRLAITDAQETRRANGLAVSPPAADANQAVEKSHVFRKPEWEEQLP